MLKELQVVVLRSNSVHCFTSNFRIEHSFSSLRICDISTNDFSGTLPIRLKAYHHLKEISENGSTTERGGIKRRRKLRIQHNLKNSLDDGMSSYGLVLVVHGHLFRALTTLLFIYNNLIGPIDPFEKVASLEIVSLQNNEMNGPIPSSIFKLVNITHLDLSSNKLDGIFKFDKLSKLKYLWALSVSNNALLSLTSGSNAYNSLPKLELSSCNISEFPNFVRNLEGLTYINLSYNKIRVIEATMFLKLQSLDSLVLPHNIPLSLSNNSNARFVLPNLSFYRCLLAIEFGIFRPSKQQHLRLKLIGEIPSAICNLMSISVLDLSNNNLSGAIPECLVLGDIRSNLNVLDLHTNKFHGNIPNSFVVNNKLPMLNLNNNDLGGPFPKSLVNCHDLEVLNLGNNKMNDTFPYWLGTLPQLQVLVLRSNYFHGQINPSENESHFSALRILDLSNNDYARISSFVFEEEIVARLEIGLPTFKWV
ncbi:Leucine-rich repeat - like 10 [Theobroma cacao]|nr:Leucine-rich repeat - like 10 [Theobroma cacao]